MLELTVPQGMSKGHEQVASFQVLGGLLQVSEERVLANKSGKATPHPPSFVAGWIRESRVCLSREKAVKQMAVFGWTSRHEPSCVGKGKRRENSVKNAVSWSAGKFWLYERDGKSAMRLDLPSQCCTSWGPRRF